MRYANYIILLVVTSLVFSCAQGENDKDRINELEITRPISAKEKEALLLKENQNQIKKFYDTIGFKIIDQILKDRVYSKKPDSRTKLQGFSLEEFPSKLKDTVFEKKIKFYSERLIEFKQNAVITIESGIAKESFSKAKEELLNSTFYRDTILGEWKDDERYIALGQDVEKIFEITKRNIKSKVEENSKSLVSNYLVENNGTKNQDNHKEEGFSKFIENYKWWLFGLLVASLLLNLFQFLKFKKTKIDLKKDYENKLKKLERTLGNDTRNFSSNNNNNKFNKQARLLSSAEVQESIHLEYKKLQQFLDSTYHKDCILSIEGKFENLKSKTIDFVRSKSITTKDDLSSFIQQHIEQNKALLRNELDNCVSKEQASHRIHKEVLANTFARAINTNILTEDEVATKVIQLKELAISELPITILKPQIATKITKLKNEITQVLQQMVKDNLVYYFAFADTNGTLNDTKKTKTIQRDSAIKLSVNPDDITKASFTLLIEKEDMMKAGIMSYDSFLIPICELKSENFNSTGNQITQIGPDGRMELENGIWKVKNKLPIKVI